MSKRSTGLFPRSGGMVDEALILENGAAKSIYGGAGVHVLAYFSSDATGSVTLTVTGGEDIVITAPTGGGKVLLERGETEMYEVTAIELDNTGLTVGSVQVSLF